MQEVLYRRRWFALKKCQVHFNLQSIATNISYLWSSLHSLFSLLLLCPVPVHWKNTLDVPHKGEFATLLFWLQPSRVCRVLPNCGFVSNPGCTTHKCSSAGSQHVCGFNGNCKTLKHPVPERRLIQVRFG